MPATELCDAHDEDCNWATHGGPDVRVEVDFDVLPGRMSVGGSFDDGTGCF